MSADDHGGNGREHLPGTDFTWQIPIRADDSIRFAPTVFRITPAADALRAGVGSKLDRTTPSQPILHGSRRTVQAFSSGWRFGAEFAPLPPRCSATSSPMRR